MSRPGAVLAALAFLAALAGGESTGRPAVSSGPVSRAGYLPGTHAPLGSSLHRSLVGLAPANPCAGIACPGGSTCRNQGGAPTCVCPPARPHMINRQCLDGPLDNAEYLDPQNYARAALGAPSLVWNASLEASALAWARTLTTCALHHPPGVPYGQNLASVWGTTTARPGFGINLWIQEAADYNYAVYPGGCRAGAVCGHYTQLIWANSRQVGCAQAPCTRDGSAGIVWACDYYPPGNFLGQLPYTRDPCTGVQCPSTSRCVGTSGTPVCTCAPGLALVNRVCQADPCRGQACPGNRACSAASGRPQCNCAAGLLPAPGNPNLCQSPVCAGVVCPATATCRGVNGVPVCTCPAGTSMIANACAPGLVPASTTSVAIYPAPGFRGPPAVIRASATCTNIPGRLAGRIQSVSVVWNAQDPGAATGSVPCKGLFFWNQVGCFGEGWGPQFTPGQILTQYPNTLNATALTYAPKAATGLSVSCG